VSRKTTSREEAGFWCELTVAKKQPAEKQRAEKQRTEKSAFFMVSRLAVH